MVIPIKNTPPGECLSTNTLQNISNTSVRFSLEYFTETGIISLLILAHSIIFETSVYLLVHHHEPVSQSLHTGKLPCTTSLVFNPDLQTGMSI